MRRLALTLAALGLWAATAAAEPLYNTPTYFEPSDTYFELVNIETIYGHYDLGAKNWRVSSGLSAKRGFKGRQGRLAIVDSQEVHEFLRDTFRPDPSSWIGLRYFCGTTSLAYPVS